MLLIYAGICSVLLSLGSAVTDEEFSNLQALVDKMQNTQTQIIISLARQVSQQQLHVEEMTRSFGDSGLKITRLTRSGSKPYFSTSYADQRVASIHEHSNYRGTVGMGELVAILNGVEFRTRHNDYKMRMPSRNSTTYGATEDIPYPEVPPQVLAKPTIELQIKEMREWFKAWSKEDYSQRDYRKYFRPNLCYLEGQWTNAKAGEIDEPFQSDRHSIDAKSFFDLQAKIRYTAVTGRKSTKENYAYLPTTISDVDEHGNIVYAQWNYRILCHPIKNYDVPLSRLRLENDIGVRVANGKTLEQFVNERSARFSVYTDPTTSRVNTKDVFVKSSRGSYMDLLMSEIPGRNNYPAKLVDDAFGDLAYPRNANLPRFPNENTTLPEPLNAGYYHNAYKVIGNDAMGVSIRRRGFSDNNLYVAYNTQPKVAEIKVQGKCTRDRACLNRQRMEAKKCRRLPKAKKNLCVKVTCPPPNCPEYKHRVSYAIPLEIIFTTPLQTWNPYKLAYSDVKAAPLKTTHPTIKRTGGLTKESAYNGISSGYYSMTPIEFFDDGKFTKDKADTTRKGGFGVLDQSGVVRQVVPSGIKIMTRAIPEVGKMRIRYPVMPIHEAGSTTYKDLQALADMTLKQNKYMKLYPDNRLDNGTIEEIFTFEMAQSSKTPPGPHSHIIDISRSEIEELKAGKMLTFVSSEVASHEHEVLLKWIPKTKSIAIQKCDGQRRCWDGHKSRVECPDCRFGLTDM